MNLTRVIGYVLRIIGYTMLVAAIVANFWFILLILSLLYTQP